VSLFSSFPPPRRFFHPRRLFTRERFLFFSPLRRGYGSFLFPGFRKRPLFFKKLPLPYYIPPPVERDNTPDGLPRNFRFLLVFFFAVDDPIFLALAEEFFAPARKGEAFPPSSLSFFSAGYSIGLSRPRTSSTCDPHTLDPTPPSEKALDRKPSCNHSWRASPPPPRSIPI